MDVDEFELVPFFGEDEIVVVFVKDNNQRFDTSYDVKYKHAAGPLPRNAILKPRYRPRKPSFRIIEDIV